MKSVGRGQEWTFYLTVPEFLGHLETLLRRNQPASKNSSSFLPVWKPRAGLREETTASVEQQLQGQTEQGYITTLHGLEHIMFLHLSKSCYPIYK